MFKIKLFKLMKGFFFNKYFATFASFFVIYILSWFLWLSNLRKEETFINNEKVFVYDYFNGFVIDKLGIGNSKLVDSYSLIRLIRDVQVIYTPLEKVTSLFGFKNIRGYYHLNAEILKNFNLLPDVQKMEIYAKLKDYHKCITIYNDNEEFEARYIREQSKKNNVHRQLIKSWGVFAPYLGIGCNQLSEDNYYNLNKNTESLSFNYSDYKSILFEAKIFSKWFNSINITINNPNFDKEFVEKYWEYIKLIEEGKEKFIYNFR